jgi:hypothetical protein
MSQRQGAQARRQHARLMQIANARDVGRLCSQGGKDRAEGERGALADALMPRMKNGSPTLRTSASKG